MERPTATMLRIGSWCINPAAGQISRNGEATRVEVRTMRLLICLAQRAGEVVSIDELLNQVWSDVTVAPDSVYQAVASLRRLLGDDPKEPAYIETVPRLGYRMIATVSRLADQAAGSTGAHEHGKGGLSEPSGSEQPLQTPTESPHLRTKSRPSLRAGFAWAVAAAICLALVWAVLVRSKFTNNGPSASLALAPQPQKSIGVLPFLDLTDEMNQEPFADGMTEELIDKLSKIPDLRVPPPTSSFYFKGKLWPRSHGTPQATIADIAKTLGVTYVLDGSVRKSGTRLRVDARLIRADNGYVVWSETYDRHFDDLLGVQDEIAGQAAKALRASIESGPQGASQRR
jgi:transcriptional activator of cad operon